MKINKNGVLIEGDYLRCAPGRNYTSFEDKDGATITIETTTLLALAELVWFDGKHRGYDEGLKLDLEVLTHKRGAHED